MATLERMAVDAFMAMCSFLAERDLCALAGSCTSIGDALSKRVGALFPL